jgi:hypothetical protein
MTMDKQTFATLMELFNRETVEILGDAKFAVEVVKIAEEWAFMESSRAGWR